MRPGPARGARLARRRKVDRGSRRRKMTWSPTRGSGGALVPRTWDREHAAAVELGDPAAGPATKALWSKDIPTASSQTSMATLHASPLPVGTRLMLGDNTMHSACRLERRQNSHGSLHADLPSGMGRETDPIADGITYDLQPMLHRRPPTIPKPLEHLFRPRPRGDIRHVGALVLGRFCDMPSALRTGPRDLPWSTST